MGLQVSGVNHDCPLFTVLGGQACHNPCEDAFLAPTLSPAVERLVWSVFFGGISPAQPFTIDENNPTQDAPIIDPRLAVRLRDKRGDLGHLLVGKPIKVALVIAPFLEP